MKYTNLLYKFKNQVQNYQRIYIIQYYDSINENFLLYFLLYIKIFFKVRVIQEDPKLNELSIFILCSFKTSYQYAPKIDNNDMQFDHF